MLTPTTTGTRRLSYQPASPVHYPYCPGCGHPVILDQLNAALVKLQLDPHKVVIVTDIGCVGMADQYFETHAFHGLHGRSVAYATGIKLANPELTVLVLMGDGGCGIGGHHLINAARRNIGVCVLVFNNLNFGMTGGQHSVTTPHGALTATTRGGNLERPLDICSTVGVNGAAYVYRGTAFDKDLSERIAEAIAVKGFALLDIWELCTAYYVPNNDYSRTDMLKLMDELKFKTGLLQRADEPELSAAYREQSEAASGPTSPDAQLRPVAGSHGAALRGKTPLRRKPVEKQFDVPLAEPVRLVLAGAAGGKVRSTATALAHAAMRCGLWCTQRDDYPVTVMSGHSISELIISPAEIFYTGIPQPDILAVLTAEGLSQVKPQLAAMDESNCVYCMPELAERVQTRARKIVFKPPAQRVNRKSLAMMAVAAILRDRPLVPLAALRAAISAEQNPEIAAEQLRAVDQGVAWL